MHARTRVFRKAPNRIKAAETVHRGVSGEACCYDATSQLKVLDRWMWRIKDIGGCGEIAFSLICLQIIFINWDVCELTGNAASSSAPITPLEISLHHFGKFSFFFFFFFFFFFETATACVR